jgi:hypothetical protein
MIMTRLEKCRLFEEKGYRYNPETGVITGIRGKVITRKHTQGYIQLAIELDGKLIQLLGHQFAWWMSYREIHDDELVIDHIDRNPSNNRISNLRVTTQLNNVINRDWIENCLGYRFYKPSGKWKASIQAEGKQKHLGYFPTEEKARAAYLAALAYYYPDRYNSLQEKGLI